MRYSHTVRIRATPVKTQSLQLSLVPALRMHYEGKRQKMVNELVSIVRAYYHDEELLEGSTQVSITYDVDAPDEDIMRRYIQTLTSEETTGTMSIVPLDLGLGT